MLQSRYRLPKSCVLLVLFLICIFHRFHVSHTFVCLVYVLTSTFYPSTWDPFFRTDNYCVPCIQATSPKFGKTTEYVRHESEMGDVPQEPNVFFHMSAAAQHLSSSNFDQVQNCCPSSDQEHHPLSGTHPLLTAFLINKRTIP